MLENGFTEYFDEFVGTNDVTDVETFEEKTDLTFEEELLAAINGTDDELYTLAQEFGEDDGYLKMKNTAYNYADVA